MPDEPRGVTYQYDTENRLKAVNDRQKLLMAASYDGDGNRTFQLNYNPEAECGYGKNVNGEVFMPENSKNEDGSLTAEGDLFSYICSATGRAYDLTEYVNDTNRQYTEVLTAYTVNSGATESYSYNGGQRLSRNNIWNEARGVDHYETSYYLYDGRGSVTANTWQNGMVTNVYQYDPYGQVTLGSTEHTDFYGYNTENYNPNTGLEYLQARYYNSNQGGFFQEDTNLGNLRDPLTLNRYVYTKNSPLNYIDPSGHALIGIAAGAIGGLLIGGVSEIVAEKLFTGKVDAFKVAISAIAGGISGALLGTGIVSPKFASAINEILSQTAEEAYEDYNRTGKIDISNLVVTAFQSGLSAYVGGDSSITTGIISGLSDFIKQILNGEKDISKVAKDAAVTGISTSKRNFGFAIRIAKI